MSDEGIDVVVEPLPVADSEETLPVWMANCNHWLRELQARTGRPVRLEWRDPDAAGLHRTNALIYEIDACI
jgi:hypothetical protein